MFANEEEGFQELFDRLLAYSSTRPTKKDDLVDVDALSNDSRKGKSKGKGKKDKTS